MAATPRSKHAGDDTHHGNHARRTVPRPQPHRSRTGQPPRHRRRARRCSRWRPAASAAPTSTSSPARTLARAPRSPSGHELSGRIVEIKSPPRPSSPSATASPCFRSSPAGCATRARTATRTCAASLRLFGFDVPGGMAEYIKLPVASLMKLPDNMPAEIGALIEPLAVAVHGVARTSLEGVNLAVVLGAGPHRPAGRAGRQTARRAQRPHLGRAALAPRARRIARPHRHCRRRGPPQARDGAFRFERRRPPARVRRPPLLRAGDDGARPLARRHRQPWRVQKARRSRHAGCQLQRNRPGRLARLRTRRISRPPSTWPWTSRSTIASSRKPFHSSRSARRSNPSAPATCARFSSYPPPPGRPPYEYDDSRAEPLLARRPACPRHRRHARYRPGCRACAVAVRSGRDPRWPGRRGA